MNIEQRLVRDAELVKEAMDESSEQVLLARILATLGIASSGDGSAAPEVRPTPATRAVARISNPPQHDTTGETPGRAERAGLTPTQRQFTPHVPK